MSSNSKHRKQPYHSLPILDISEEVQVSKKKSLNSCIRYHNQGFIKELSGLMHIKRHLKYTTGTKNNFFSSKTGTLHLIGEILAKRFVVQNHSIRTDHCWFEVDENRSRNVLSYKNIHSISAIKNTNPKGYYEWLP